MTIIDQPITASWASPASPERADASTRGRLVGVEHEYVLRRESERVDARRTVELTRLASPALDPGDPNARRLAWGGVVTFDGPELEVVTPPTATRPGFATRVTADCARGRADLEAFLPDGLVLEGFSTHLNISVTPGREITVAKRFIATFSAAMMLLLDGPDSPGILVRPRPGRLEIGGEFQDGQALTAALVFATGAARCCDVPRRQWNHATRHQLASLNPKVERAIERFGWFIDRTAFGPDLYQEGRDATLPLRGGGTISVQGHLESSWHRAHLALADDVSDTERHLVDNVIHGQRPLPCEMCTTVDETRMAERTRRTQPGVPVTVKRTPHFPIDSLVAQTEHGIEELSGFSDALDRSPFGSLITPRVRGSLRLTAEVVTWGFVVFTLTDGTRTCHLTMPGPELESFLDGVDDGALDTELHHRLDRPRRTKLARASQTGSVDTYRDLPNPAALLPPERNPDTGRFPRGSGGGLGGGRPGKRQHNELQPPTRPKWVRPVVIGAVALVAIIAIAAALSSQGGNEPALATAGSLSPDEASVAQSSTTQQTWSTSTGVNPVVDLDGHYELTLGLGLGAMTGPPALEASSFNLRCDDDKTCTDDEASSRTDITSRDITWSGSTVTRTTVFTMSCGEMTRTETFTVSPIGEVTGTLKGIVCNLQSTGTLPYGGAINGKKTALTDPGGGGTFASGTTTPGDSGTGSGGGGWDIPGTGIGG